MTNENRNFKNSVFVDLFYEDESAVENDISLYNALHDTPLPKEIAVKRFRIDNVLYMNFKNDISFGVNSKIMVFGEHQSTVNENMPLRSLLYVGRAYEQIVPFRDRYKRKRLDLPKPEFYTFYNGRSKGPKEQILKLSDAYIVKDKMPSLELNVRVININPSEGHEILRRCPILMQYGEFVDMVRKYQDFGDCEAYKHAVEECIRQGILTDYLKRKGSEVINMLIAEYDYDMDIEVQREEAFEEGEKAGYANGEKAHLLQQIAKKLDKGKSIISIAEELEESIETIQSLILKENLQRPAV